ncbi:MAG: hypothetical protein R2856_14545 [Caldilineaceae bacterium]
MLSDPEKRRIYDQVGANWQQRSGAEPFNWSGWFGEDDVEPRPRRQRPRAHRRSWRNASATQRARQLRSGVFFRLLSATIRRW